MNAKPKDMDEAVEAPLYRWRAQALNWILGIACIVGLPALVITFIQISRAPQEWSGWLLVVSYVALVVMTFRPRLDPNIRAWGLLLLLYEMGVVDYARDGLLGDGRLLFLIVPVIAVVLAGIRSGLVATGLSVLTLVLFVVLSQ